MAAPLCEECNGQYASFGLADEGKIRWCFDCAQKHNAVILGRTMCETCGLKQAKFGDKPGKRKRWCKACGEGRHSLYLIPRCRTMCEDCGKKRPHFGTEQERRARWCARCGQKHNAIRVHAPTLCEGCGQKHRNYGMASDRKRRWCKACGRERGAILISVPGDKGDADGTPADTAAAQGLPLSDPLSHTLSYPVAAGQPAEHNTGQRGSDSLPAAVASAMLQPLVPVPHGCLPSTGQGVVERAPLLSLCATALPLSVPSQKRRAIEAAVGTNIEGQRVALEARAGQPTAAPAIASIPRRAPTFLGI